MDYLMKGDSFMHKLSDTEIDFIAKKIKEQSLKSFAFSDELIDHVCCRIEQLMENGSTFESALNQSSHLYQRNEIKKIKKNFTIILNYSGFMNSLIIYASLLFYLGSWIFQWGQVDWVGLVAFVLISILIFRYSLLFYSDNNLRFKKSLVILSSVGFALFFIACLKRFLWLNFGFSGQHVMPVFVVDHFNYRPNLHQSTVSYKTKQIIIFSSDHSDCTGMPESFNIYLSIYHAVYSMVCHNYYHY